MILLIKEKANITKSFLIRYRVCLRILIECVYIYYYYKYFLLHLYKKKLNKKNSLRGWLEHPTCRLTA